eukprot:CAMPEP_0118925804 /NCGR_PEP_ID=MMETSP1169-20130426/3633_1 /TAXON_ID=36882 /ORGANISM="Pyramimonas obovata, Strain CCMP722" /LENGTH=80 /DNA_ID=CAMNT_0006867205 /DNA_START=178 /DNA_END=420 /DNA_ORIENTATION=-
MMSLGSCPTHMQLYSVNSHHPHPAPRDVDEEAELRCISCSQLTQPQTVACMDNRTRVTRRVSFQGMSRRDSGRSSAQTGN